MAIVSINKDRVCIWYNICGKINVEMGAPEEADSIWFTKGCGIWMAGVKFSFRIIIGFHWISYNIRMYQDVFSFEITVTNYIKMQLLCREGMTFSLRKNYAILIK